jgi:hypothetical protein
VHRGGGGRRLRLRLRLRRLRRRRPAYMTRGGHFRLVHLMPPKISKRKGGESESSNLSKRILRAMHAVGIPETAARVRYARLFMCLHAMRGVCKRWQAAWALHHIIKDWILCPADEPASEFLLNDTQRLEDQLAEICYENVPQPK